MGRKSDESMLPESTLPSATDDDTDVPLFAATRQGTSSIYANERHIQEPLDPRYVRDSR